MSADPVLEPYGPVLETTVRVASWNTWSRFGPWQSREAVLLDHLRAASPNVICLQEAWITSNDSQAERFAVELGMHQVQSSDLEYLGVQSGQAVLSQWPISRLESLRVAGPEGNESSGDKLVSGATFATIEGPRGPINVVSLILTWRLDHSAVRGAHLKRILSWARELSDRNELLVIAGDFNATPESDELRAMVGLAAPHAPNMVFYDAISMRIDGPGHTWSERNPFSAVGLYGNKRLDHIFSHWPKPHGAGHPVAASIIGDEPVDGMWASDHFGVIADLRY